MKKSTQILISTIVGIALMLTILILAVLFPCPTISQYIIFRIILSAAVGAFASIIPGLFEFKHNGLVTATGALGVFALVFLSDPTQLVVTDDCSSDLYLAGSIFINNKEAKNVDVRVSSLKKSDVTDEYGTFKIDYPKKEHKESLNFRVIHSTSLDTSFTVKDKDWRNLRFDFAVDNTKIAVNPASKPTETEAIKVPVKLPKKEIQNFFTGMLPVSATVSYGGEPYCNYWMQYKDVNVQIKLTGNRKNVQSAKVTFKATEKANSGCPYQTAGSNTHVYDLSSATIQGENILISFTPDPSNNPLCSLTLNGVIEENKIIATLNSERIDMPDSKLVFRIKMDMNIDLTE